MMMIIILMIMMLMTVMMMMMMMMMLMLMRRPSSLRVRAKPKHLPNIYIYVSLSLSLSPSLSLSLSRSPYLTIAFFEFSPGAKNQPWAQCPNLYNFFSSKEPPCIRSFNEFQPSTFINHDDRVRPPSKVSMGLVREAEAPSSNPDLKPSASPQHRRSRCPTYLYYDMVIILIYLLYIIYTPQVP